MLRTSLEYEGALQFLLTQVFHSLIIELGAAKDRVPFTQHNAAEQSGFKQQLS